MSTEGETLQVFVLPYTCSICPPLVTRQMSNFGKFQDTGRFLISCPRLVSSRLLPSGETCKYAMAPSTQKKTCRDSPPADLLLSAVLSWLLRSRFRKFRSDLRITLYNLCLRIHFLPNRNTVVSILKANIFISIDVILVL
jgi:hypothetical protein